MITYFGLSGLLIRASGILLDYRLFGYEAYYVLSFNSYVSFVSDCLDRYLCRFNEFIESSRLIYLCLYSVLASAHSISFNPISHFASLHSLRSFLPSPPFHFGSQLASLPSPNNNASRANHLISNSVPSLAPRFAPCSLSSSASLSTALTTTSSDAISNSFSPHHIASNSQTLYPLIYGHLSLINPSSGASLNSLSSHTHLFARYDYSFMETVISDFLGYFNFNLLSSPISASNTISAAASISHPIFHPISSSSYLPAFSPSPRSSLLGFAEFTIASNSNLPSPLALHFAPFGLSLAFASLGSFVRLRLPSLASTSSYADPSTPSAISYYTSISLSSASPSFTSHHISSQSATSLRSLRSLRSFSLASLASPASPMFSRASASSSYYTSIASHSNPNIRQHSNSTPYHLHSTTPYLHAMYSNPPFSAANTHTLSSFPYISQSHSFNHSNHSVGHIMQHIPTAYYTSIESSKGIYSTFMCMENFTSAAIHIVCSDYLSISALNKYSKNVNLADLIAILGSIDFVLGSVDM
jgi:hypothetical protein